MVFIRTWLGSIPFGKSTVILAQPSSLTVINPRLFMVHFLFLLAYFPVRTTFPSFRFDFSDKGSTVEGTWTTLWNPLVPSKEPKQWRIQDFPQGGAPTPKITIIFQSFAENCMKMKEFGPPGGARVPGAPLDPPMQRLFLLWSALYFYQRWP